jgi:hypothetical protein
MAVDELEDFYVHTAIVRTSKGVNSQGVTLYKESEPFPLLLRGRFQTRS